MTNEMMTTEDSAPVVLSKLPKSLRVEPASALADFTAESLSELLGFRKYLRLLFRKISDRKVKPDEDELKKSLLRILPSSVSALVLTYRGRKYRFDFTPQSKIELIDREAFIDALGPDAGILKVELSGVLFGSPVAYADLVDLVGLLAPPDSEAKDFIFVSVDKGKFDKARSRKRQPLVVPQDSFRLVPITPQTSASIEP